MDLINHYADLAFAAYKANDQAGMFYAKKGFNATPIHRSERDRDEGYLLRRNGALTITIRGSDDIQDWCETNLCAWRNWRNAHAGFAAAARQLYIKIRPTIAIYMAEDTSRNLPVTVLGHSRGGAIGLHLASLMVADGYQVDLCSFGAPRAANAAWVKTADFHHRRVVHVDDLVPHLPPEIMGYKHHGIPFVIGQKMPERSDLAWQKLKLKSGGYRSVLEKIKADRWIKGHFAYSRVTGQ